MKTALITGSAGQDGTILATQLARQGMNVVGMIKPGTDTELLRRYVPDITIADCDLGDPAALRALASSIEPAPTAPTASVPSDDSAALAAARMCWT